jgi:hypothetical protein
MRRFRPLILWLLLPAISLAAQSCTPSAPVVMPSPVDRPAVIKEGRTWNLASGYPRLDIPRLICGKNGRMWAIGQTELPDNSNAIICARFDGQAWTSMTEVVAPIKFTNSDMTACLDKDDNPVVLWMDNTQPGMDTLFWSRRTAEGWSKPEGIAQAPGRMFPKPSACRNAQGYIHVVYRSELDPPEQYSQGLIIADGIWTPKYYHLYYDGQKWSTPQPTTGRGRFGVGDARLSLEPGGQLCLVTNVTEYPQLESRSSYLGCQLWDGKSWSDIRRLSPKGADVSEGSAAIDAHGDWHAAWRNSGGTGYYWRTSQDGKPLLNLPCGPYTDPAVQSNAWGWALLCQKANMGFRAMAWTGKEWTPELIFPPPADPAPLQQLTTAPNGAIYVVSGSWGKMYINELLPGGEEKP